MRRLHFTTALCIFVTTLTIISVVGPSAWAIQVGPDPFGSHNINEFSFDSTVGGTGGFEVGTTDERIDLTFDPTFGPWIKQLSDTPAATVGTVWTIQEHYVLNGDMNWTNWNEQLLTNGWNWINGTIQMNGQTISGLTTNMEAAAEGLISFTFDALAPGTTIDIVKQIQWVGTAGVSVWPGIALIQVQEWSNGEQPIPEPATLSLIALGGSLYALARQRRRALLSGA